MWSDPSISVGVIIEIKLLKKIFDLDIRIIVHLGFLL